MSPEKKRRVIAVLVVLGVLIAVVAFTAWYKFFREVPEAPFASMEERFKYGSIGAEADAGLPYWIFVVLPRVFPDLLPGSGGYRSFGVVWEEGHELPAGFTKKVIGFARVANNCAICHTATYRSRPDQTPVVIASGPSHTVNVQGFIRYLTNCANDVRFNPDTLMAEITRHASMSFLDRMIYRYVIIPRTKKALQDRGKQFTWMNRPHWPDWGVGRDDPMNLTKYFMTSMPVDDTIGSADFPSTWNLKMREGMMLNWGGETPSPRSVIIDSALGLQAKPATVQGHVDWIKEFLDNKQPPKYPFPVDDTLAAKGKALYDAQCNSCHGLGGGTRVGKVIDVAEIGTDPNRLITWTKQAADIANQTVAKLGIHRTDMVKTNGYQSVPLDGIWLRAPYLHNGSVANLRDLLEPQEKRSPVFYRGYDVYDPAAVGFDTQSAEAQRVGMRFDTAVRGNGNQGHLYGVKLAPPEKTALLEYMKTL